MTFRFSAIGTVCLLAACAPSIPDSNPGVGFSDYDSFAAERAQRDAALEAQRPSPVPTEPRIGEETLAVLAATERAPGAVTVEPAPNSTVPASAAPISSQTGEGAPLSAIDEAILVPVPNNPEISDEQSFDAVAGRQTIESDAERLARLAATREVVAPVPVPERTNSGRPNVVAFALATQHQIGDALYSRSGSTSTSRFQRNCARFVNNDLAQEEFLANGGPERDRGGLDPDGDGFACFWNPAPYRAARGG